ncbi:hypothetical protein ACM6Q7_03860 [Peribacillus butanolivorans]
MDQGGAGTIGWFKIYKDGRVVGFFIEKTWIVILKLNISIFFYK